MHHTFPWGAKGSTKKLRSMNDSYARFLHGYLYLRFTREYIKLLDKTKEKLGKHGGVSAAIDRSLSEWYRQAHHSKVITSDQAKGLVSQVEDIEIDHLEQVLPFVKARRIILENPDEIVVTDCPCRELQVDPCHPVDVCFVVGAPLAGFMLEHKVRNARKISQEEAVGRLDEERRRGRVHTAWFKDVLGDRFYAICNCCRCCCLGLKAFTEHDTEVVVSSGYAASTRPGCNGCAQCVDSCAFGALAPDCGSVVVDKAVCMGCGVCTNVCEREGIFLEIDESKPRPLEIEGSAESD
ncbi:MAG: 4Fe-4S ferredoxin [Terriglobia bacterium]